MKHDDMRSIAHNLAHALTSDVSFLMQGIWCVDVFQEAAESADQRITVDFLSGVVTEGSASPFLRTAISRARDALPSFCAKLDGTREEFRLLKATFWAGESNRRVTVNVGDSTGQVSSDEYAGYPLARIRTLDDRGRVRKFPTKRGHPA
jgi:hypothetical protein